MNGTTVKMYCIKHGSIRMQVGDKWIYVDPVTTAVKPETDYSTLPKADYILVTHEHFDHLDSVAINQLSKEGTELITNARCHEILGGKGKVMANGDFLELPNGWTVDAVPAYNNSPEKLQGPLTLFLPTTTRPRNCSSIPRDVTTASCSPSRVCASTSPATPRISPRWPTSRTSMWHSCPVTCPTR